MPKRGAQPGHPRYAGRAKGSKNKATIERELLAADIAKRQMSRAHEQGRELGVEALERYQKLFEGAAAILKPSEEEIVSIKVIDDKTGMGAKAEHLLGLFREWLAEARDTAKMLAEFQSPKFRAIAIAPTPQVEEGERKKVFTLTVFEGGRALPPPEPPKSGNGAA
jgi:hypothetical protein